uniref:NADH dehydrogenase subunit 4L n=1 Tax=Biomphalaria tenagophila TaxID=112528 RepID=A9XII8_BIOTE|nr:NADH dehydrogenase subunit 4L [Biomphalaria tenagophila]ABO14135.1 NADH dehydrogenase subunit 4L [Biomphalaria tenagophila]
MILSSISLMSLTFVCFLVFSYLINKKYILSSLILLEGMMLMSMVFMIFSLMSIYESMYMFLMILTFAACEAAIGLSLLVSFLRLRGNHLLKSIVYFAKNSWIN